MRKCAFFQLTDKTFLAITISIYVIGELLSEVLFEIGIVVTYRFMCTHIISECKMPADISPIFCLENMHLMGAFIAAFSQISSACNAKLPKILIAYGRKFFRNSIHLLQVSDNSHNVNNRFGCQAWNGCAANMVNGQTIFFQDFCQTCPLALILLRPFRVIIQNCDVLWHDGPSSLFSKTASSSAHSPIPQNLL